MINRRALSTLLAIGVGFVIGGAASADERQTKPELKVDYSQLKPDFPGKTGVFRDQTQPPEEQWIKEEKITRALPGMDEGMLGFLRLTYIVKGQGTYNGYWWQYRKRDDWAAFKNGNLVLRLAAGEQGCTPRFKVEVKTSKTEKSALTKYEQYVWFGDQKHFDQLKKQGFIDVSLPLAEFKAELDLVDGKFVVPVLSDNMSHVAEIVIVFENSEIPVSKQTGELLINQIRLEKHTESKQLRQTEDSQRK